MITTTVTNNPTFTFSGAITESGGARGITKAGPGRLVLSGDATYTGATTVRTGTLTVKGLGTSSGVTLGDPLSAVDDEISLFVGGGVFGGPIVVNASNGSAPTVLGGDTDVSSTFSGPVTLNRPLALASAAVGPNAVSFTGPVTGAFELTTLGRGVVVLGNAANTFGTGSPTSVNIAEGMLSVASDSALGNPANGVTFGGDSGLRATGTFTTSRALAFGTGVNRIDVSGGNTLSVTGTLSSGSLVDLIKTGAGTLNLNSAANTVNGTTTVSGGTLGLGGNEQLPNVGNLTLSTGGLVNLNGKTETISELVVSDGFLLFNGGVLNAPGNDFRGDRILVQIPVRSLPVPEP